MTLGNGWILELNKCVIGWGGGLNIYRADGVTQKCIQKRNLNVNSSSNMIEGEDDKFYALCSGTGL